MKETGNESHNPEKLTPQAKAEDKLMSEVLGAKTESRSSEKDEKGAESSQSLFLSVMGKDLGASGTKLSEAADGKNGKDAKDSKDPKAGKDGKKRPSGSGDVDEREHAKDKDSDKDEPKDPKDAAKDGGSKSKDDGLGSLGSKGTEVKAENNSMGILGRASLMAMHTVKEATSAADKGQDLATAAGIRSIIGGAAELISNDSGKGDSSSKNGNDGIAASKADKSNGSESPDNHELRHLNSADKTNGSDSSSLDKRIDVTIKSVAIESLMGTAASITVARSIGASELLRKEGGALSERQVTNLESNVSAQFNHIEPTKFMHEKAMMDAMPSPTVPGKISEAYAPKITELVIPRPDTKREMVAENLSNMHVGDMPPTMAHDLPIKAMMDSPTKAMMDTLPSANNVYVPLSNFHQPDIGSVIVPGPANKELIAYNVPDLRATTHDVAPIIGPVFTTGPIVEKPPVHVIVPTPDVTQPIVRTTTVPSVVVSGNGDGGSRQQLAFIPNSQKNFWESPQQDRNADQSKSDREAADRRVQEEKAKEAKAAEQKLAEQKLAEQKAQEQKGLKQEKTAEIKPSESKSEAKIDPVKVREETVSRILDAAVKSFQAAQAGHTIHSNNIESMTLNTAHLKGQESARYSSSGLPISGIISLAGGKPEPQEKSATVKTTEASVAQHKQVDLPQGPMALTKNGLAQEKAASAQLESKAVQANLAQTSVVLKAIEAGGKGTNLNLDQATGKVANKSLEQSAVSARTADGIMGVKSAEQIKPPAISKPSERSPESLKAADAAKGLVDSNSKIAKFAGVIEASSRLSSDVNIKTALRVSPADLTGSTLRSWAGDLGKFRADALPRVTESTISAQNSALNQLKTNLSIPVDLRSAASGNAALIASNKQVSDLNTRAASATVSDMTINASKRLSEEPRLLVNRMADVLNSSKAFDTAIPASTNTHLRGAGAETNRGIEAPKASGLVNLDYVYRSVDSIKTWEAWAQRTQASNRKLTGSKNRIPEDRIDRSLLKTDFYDIPEIAGIEGDEKAPAVPNKTAFLIALLLGMSGVSRRRGSTVSTENVQGLLNSFSKAAQGENQAPNSFKHLHRRTHLVEPGDTLQSIAERYYSDSRVAWLIADLNQSAIDEHGLDVKRVVELRARQTLELPEAEEVQAFLSAIPRDFDIEQRLVTIVNDTMINMEILRQFLGPIIGNLKAQDQADQQKELLGEFTILGADCA